ncbi:MAG: adenylosuccinate lyase [Bacteroidetes bacterium]|nr:adenylosuccinate lyase [Bacteroidota bacterium]
MKSYNLQAISPIDGRYASKVSELSTYFSEYALIKYRVFIEIEYFISLCNFLDELEEFDKKDFAKIRNIHQNFTIDDAIHVKEIEALKNHDVKAIEYFLKEKFEENGWGKFKEFIHFGLTSQDINNTAIPLMLMDALFHVYLPELTNLANHLQDMAIDWQHIPMLSRTHGQPASPTLMGKEIKIFVERIQEQLKLLSHIPIQGKFGGATGNFNAHYAAYPESDWIAFANMFLERIGLERQQFTSQIEHYDNLAAMFDIMKRINTILLDFSKDMWTYISMDYFTQTIQEGEVGSSAMPHKVNPIDFENAEGNLGIANALFEHLSAKLPVSRLQRDLTDSTVTRIIGTPIAHSILSLKSLATGLSKLTLNKDKLYEDLEDNWVVVAEAIQTVLRKISYPEPYEALKELTRKNKKIGKAELHDFIDKLDIKEEIKTYLKHISPHNYTGKSPDYSKLILPEKE